MLRLCLRSVPAKKIVVVMNVRQMIPAAIFVTWLAAGTRLNLPDLSNRGAILCWVIEPVVSDSKFHEVLLLTKKLISASKWSSCGAAGVSENWHRL